MAMPSVTSPVASAAGVKVSLLAATRALMSAIEPSSDRASVPSPSTVTPLPEVAASVPSPAWTANDTAPVALPASASLNEMPVTALAVSSATKTGEGAATAGAWLSAAS
jgi:hypothetical protein